MSVFQCEKKKWTICFGVAKEMKNIELFQCNMIFTWNVKTELALSQKQDRFLYSYFVWEWYAKNNKQLNICSSIEKCDMLLTYYSSWI